MIHETSQVLSSIQQAKDFARQTVKMRERLEPVSMNKEAWPEGPAPFVASPLLALLISGFSSRYGRRIELLLRSNFYSAYRSNSLMAVSPALFNRDR